MNNQLTCDFCNKIFVREKNYLKHKCELMKRYEIFDTIDGQFSFIAFNNWRKFKKFPPVNVEVFTTSRYFKAFINFSSYSRRQSMPDRIGFIKFMAEKDIQPFYWCDYDVYDLYLQMFDETYSIDEKIEISIHTLKELAEYHNCSLDELFNNVHIIEVIKMITSRKLSPWVLLPSNKFKKFIKYKLTDEERMLVTTFIDPATWKKNFESNPDLVNNMKEITCKLGL